jgi:CTP:molybdopterin cytidylyltransferase MocA
LRASYDGRPGHPVLFERAAFASLRTLEGDAGARHLFAAMATRLVACDGLGSDDDIDTAADLAARPVARDPVAPSAEAATSTPGPKAASPPTRRS